MRESYDVVMLRRNDFTVDGRVERQAASLAARGMRVLVIALGGESLPRRVRLEGYDLERVRVDPVTGLAPRAIANGSRPRPLVTRALTRAAVLAGTATYYAAAARRIQQTRPRVVHCHDVDTLGPGLAGARAVDARVIYDSAELWVERNTGYHGVRRALDRARYRAMEGALVPHADAVITVSEGIVDELARRYGIAPPLLIRNVPRTPDPTLRRSLRERLGGDDPLLLHLGTVDMNRGLEEAVDALPHVPGRLVLLGPARSYVLEPLLARAARLGVRERVVHLPPVPRDEIIAWAQDAALGLCTFRPTCLSHVLALPNKLFEYAFAGVPVVASDFPDMGAFVSRERAGTLWDTRSPESLREAMLRALRPESRPSAAQVESLRARYAWEVEFETLWALYGRLTSPRR